MKKKVFRERYSEEVFAMKEIHDIATNITKRAIEKSIKDIKKKTTKKKVGK